MGQSCTKPRPDGTFVAIVDLLLGSRVSEPGEWALRARIGVGVAVNACLPAPIVREETKLLRFCCRDYSSSPGGWRTSTGARRWGRY